MRSIMLVRTVQLEADSDGVQARLVIDDDGTGFEQADLDRRFAEGHIGLRSVGDLVAESGGRLTVRSAPGQGTRAEVTIGL